MKGLNIALSFVSSLSWIRSSRKLVECEKNPSPPNGKMFVLYKAITAKNRTVTLHTPVEIMSVQIGKSKYLSSGYQQDFYWKFVLNTLIDK